MVMHTGSCSCGLVEITATAEPLLVSMCHCLLCQKRTGSTYSVHAYLPSESVAVNGATKSYVRTGDSGAYVYFHFCHECGSTMYWEVEATPGRTGIPVGVFADPTFHSPTASSFVPLKHPWVLIPEGIPQY
jgi:hypothetical protein